MKMIKIFSYLTIINFFLMASFAGASKPGSLSMDCNGTLGDFKVIVKPLKNREGLYKISIKAKEINASKIRVALLKKDELFYKQMQQGLELKPGEKANIGIVSRDELEKYDTFVLKENGSPDHTFLEAANAGKSNSCPLSLPEFPKNKKAGPRIYGRGYCDTNAGRFDLYVIPNGRRQYDLFLLPVKDKRLTGNVMGDFEEGDIVDIRYTVRKGATGTLKNMQVVLGEGREIHAGILGKRDLRSLKELIIVPAMKKEIAATDKCDVGDIIHGLLASERRAKQNKLSVRGRSNGTH